MYSNWANLTFQEVGTDEDADKTESFMVDAEVLKHEEVNIPMVPGDDFLPSKVGRSLQRNV